MTCQEPCTGAETLFGGLHLVAEVTRTGFPAPPTRAQSATPGAYIIQARPLIIEKTLESVVLRYQ
jgi:hypothetical protein